MKRYADAENVFREDLRRNPKNGRSQFGLGEALRHQGKTQEADTVQRNFLEAWKNADMTLSVESL